MKKLIIFFVVAFFPLLVFADDTSLTFAPPVSDWSVVFLGNLFGVVDGVLHGSGSQILGVMFGVFNAAVLAVGGCIITYTVIVATMNTAHEGQMLGQKWSSMWIPLRSTIGIILLIPKASGYSLMQVTFMWVVLQGVGAADRVWEAALSYLNRGGVIIQQQTSNPAIKMIADNKLPVAKGAAVMLAGQVCMMGLQTQLESLREQYKDQTKDNAGPCLDPKLKLFCDTSVPDFVGSFNAVAEQAKNPTATPFTVKMPNTDNAVYGFLNGICGTIQWKGISQFGANAPGVGQNYTFAPGLEVSRAEYQTLQMSKAIAIQQMYLDLTPVARSITNNNPLMVKSIPTPEGSSPKVFSAKAAIQQFGVPYTKSGTICNTAADKTCFGWGPDTGWDNTGVLLNGMEYRGAMIDYDAILKPTMNMLENMQKPSSAKNREFINQAKSQGWIMAGSYFFDLVKLNGNAASSGTAGLEAAEGLEGSSFGNYNVFNCGSDSTTYKTMCDWMGQYYDKLKGIVPVINGEGVLGAPLPLNVDNKDSLNSIGGLGSSTVYGYVMNSLMLNLPDQPGVASAQFAIVPDLKVKMDLSGSTAPLIVENKCYKTVKLGVISLDLPEGDMFQMICCYGLLALQKFGNIFVSLYNLAVLSLEKALNGLLKYVIQYPMAGLAFIFQLAVQVMSSPGINPVVALANMGIQYINFCHTLWLGIIVVSEVAMMTPMGTSVVLGLMAFTMPVLAAWLSIMMAIGFLTAYYIPILPYMMFTMGAIGWLIAVIEAMVAAPLVALAVAHPEGHESFGKAEHAIMILMNVFLRPSMMVIGYIVGIALTYVGIWILNAGFEHAIDFMHNTQLQDFDQGGTTQTVHTSFKDANGHTLSFEDKAHLFQNPEINYAGWAWAYAFFFSVLIYTSMYLTIVQKAFSLISLLPDQVLRWVGGSPESYGKEAAQWAEEPKGMMKENIPEISKSGVQAGQLAAGKVGKVLSKLRNFGGKGAGKLKIDEDK